MTHDEKLLSTKRFSVVRRRDVSPAGRPHEREVIVHPGAVTIIPLLDDGRVCLIRNYRLATGETLIELPAGTLDPGEDPRATAHRELIEETGYEAQSLDLLAEFFLSPGILSEKMRLYVATGLCDVGPRREANEEIENLPLPWSEALDLIDRGEIRDAKTIVGLLLYDRRRGAK